MRVHEFMNQLDLARVEASPDLWWKEGILSGRQSRGSLVERASCLLCSLLSCPGGEGFLTAGVLAL